MVVISFAEIGRGWLAELTDSNGVVAYFDADEGEAKVIVDGSDCGTYYLEEGDEVTVSDLAAGSHGWEQATLAYIELAVNSWPTAIAEDPLVLRRRDRPQEPLVALDRWFRRKLALPTLPFTWPPEPPPH